MLSLSDSVLLNILRIQALVLLELVLRLGVWLALSELAIQLWILTSCLLVELLLYWDFDYEQVEK